ncbi:MAG: 2TM domain-containing protein [Hyphomicrobiaceae bacterium]
MSDHPPPADGDQAPAGVSVWQRIGRRLGLLLPWHVGIFAALNIVLTVANIATGRPWWAVWPLIVSGAALALHYFLYRATAVDEAWVAARIAELNLKSYDRAHIENIKERVEKHGYGKPRDEGG